MQMARLIGTTVLRRKFRRVRAIAGDRRARLDPAAAAARASLAAMVAPILSCFFIWGGGGGLAWAQTAGVEDLGSPVHHVVVTLHKSRTLRVDRPFSTTVIGSPEIADVLPMTDTTFYVQGKRVGTTNISVFDWERHLLAVIDLEVTPDTATLHSNIVATTGGENINVTSANGQVVLSGEANDAVGAARAVEVAKGLSPNAPVINALRISPSQQVMKVRILEVDRSAGRDLGVNWFGANKYGLGVSGLGALPNSATAVQSTLTTSSTGTGGVASTTANIAGNSIGVSGSSVASSSGTSLTGVPLLSSVFPGAAATAAPFGALLAQVINTHGLQIDTLISALEEKGLVKSLAEPDLVALSGETAKFLAGGEIAVPVVQPSSGGTTVTIEWKNYGVGLAFTPTVLNGSIINLRLERSVSELDTAHAILVNGTLIPGIIDREVHTSVELRDGQSFAIAGLLQAQSNEDISQIPWLGNVPILGALFRSTNYQKQESDLVVIVSPHIVRPAPPGQRLATPFDTTLQANDIDLFLMGDTERVKRYTDYVASGGGLNGPYGHILQAK
ncbi:MAG TPA: type II and III secretion system protein family protein [Roseiarcus sp.]|nr:type II and III secretion system protein family protein [Roseiarcus sp.]